MSEPDPVVPWFFTLGRLETISFVTLLGIAMPLKYAAGIPEPVGWVGWIHGVLLIVYVIGLLSVARIHRVGFVQVAIAGVLALLPFGPLVLEYLWRKRGVLDRR
jgi:integral membrane protein